MTSTFSQTEAMSNAGHMKQARKEDFEALSTFLHVGGSITQVNEGPICIKVGVKLAEGSVDKALKNIIFKSSINTIMRKNLKDIGIDNK